MSEQLSVILLCPDEYATIRKTLLHLARQTIAQSLEIVIVAPPNVSCIVEDAKKFGRITNVVDSIASVGAAYAAGIRAAGAAVIALAEDHSFPQPGWAEALVNAHAQDFAAVGPAIANANPHSLVSKADLLSAYGPWLSPAVSVEQQHLPGHNSSYKRDILLQYGERLDAMMEAESVLHWDLRRRGFRLFLEGAAVTAHTNFEKWSSYRSAQFHSGRMFAASRSMNEQWSLPRRVLFALTWPLIPIVRIFRIGKILRQPGRSLQEYLPALPVLLVGFYISAIGEAIGCIAGMGSSQKVLVEMEFHRDLHRKAARSTL